MSATIQFPPISNTTPANTTFSSIVKEINRPLCEQDRLLLVYTATIQNELGTIQVDPLPVTASAGIIIYYSI
jgi:hypothetical protein